ncbi:MAG: TIGR00180 family glycosyltransferase [Candidatus Omnitrophica bacterium]|nr:TIGR00180 family glycosyltransferase [Candidatus Omnitrophota bacterium]
MPPEKESPVSMVMPTRNRSHFLDRLFVYYSKQGSPFVLWIGDGSDPEEYERTEALVKRYASQIPIVHRRFPPETSPEQCMVALLSEIRTPYAVFSGDDDYYVPSHIQRCVDFLESHPDYVSACGASAWVCVNESEDGRFNIWKVLRGPHANIEQEWASERIRAYSYPTTLMNAFTVLRTECMRYGWSTAALLGLHETKAMCPVMELSHTLMTPLQGKQKCLPGLYHVMLRHDQKYWASASMDTFDRIAQWDWAKIQAVVKFWAQELMQRESIEERNALATARACFLYWFGNLVTRLRNGELRVAGSPHRPQEAEIRVRHAVKSFPGAKKLWHWLKREQEFSLSMLMDPRYGYWKDFQPIYEILSTPNPSWAAQQVQEVR